MNNCRKILFILFFLLFPSWSLAVTPPIPAHPSQYVVDLAGVMDADTRASLNGMLKDLEERTTAQVVVLTLNSLQGEPIESFSHQTAVKWGIGQKGKDNGVLITVAVKDRKYRIEVGYGLESTLPDSLVGSIGRQHLVPHFRKGDFAGGLVAAVTEITSTITGGPNPEGTPASPEEKAPQQEAAGPNPLLLILLILSFVLVPMLIIWLIFRRLRKKGGRHDDEGYWFGGFGGGGGWSSGGGDSGGFSGGGGDFGGGGASGDW